MQRIIFFDGICPLCNSFIDRVFYYDKTHIFTFSPLQSNTAKKLLPAHDLGLDTLVYYEDGKIYYKSTAVLRILFQLGGLWSLLSLIFAILPTFIRDYIYSLVAKNRYRYFGQMATCRLATKEEKQYFLD